MTRCRGGRKCDGGGGGKGGGRTGGAAGAAWAALAASGDDGAEATGEGWSLESAAAVRLRPFVCAVTLSLGRPLHVSSTGASAVPSVRK